MVSEKVNGVGECVLWKDGLWILCRGGNKRVDTCTEKKGHTCTCSKGKVKEVGQRREVVRQSIDILICAI